MNELAKKLLEILEAEARAQNEGINPQMAASREDVHGTRWNNNGPNHDLRPSQPSEQGDPMRDSPKK